MYFNPSSQSTGFNSGTTGSWVLGNNIAGNDSKSFSIYNPNLGVKNFKLDISGNALLTNKLTISGTLQSPLTSLIGVSFSNVDIKSTLISNTIWGITSADKQINVDTNLAINNGNADNSYMKFGKNGGRKSFIGQINGSSNGDIFIRQASSGSMTYLQNSSASNICYLDNSGNVNQSGTLTANGGSSFNGVQDALLLYNGGGNCNIKIQ